MDIDNQSETNSYLPEKVKKPPTNSNRKKHLPKLDLTKAEDIQKLVVENMMKKHNLKHEPINTENPEKRIAYLKKEINELKLVLDKQMILN